MQDVLEGPGGERGVGPARGGRRDGALGVALQTGVGALVHVLHVAAQLRLELVPFGTVLRHGLVLVLGRLGVGDVVDFLPFRPPILEPNLHLQRETAHDLLKSISFSRWIQVMHAM